MFAQKCKSCGNPIELNISETKLFDAYKNHFQQRQFQTGHKVQRQQRINKRLQNNKKVPCGFKLVPQ